MIFITQKNMIMQPFKNSFHDKDNSILIHILLQIMETESDKRISFLCTRVS